MFGWDDCKQGIEQAASMTRDWSYSAFEQSSDMIKRSGLPETLGDLWNGSQSSPSPAKYSECKDLNGESIWDETGAWRCLFPKATRPPVWYSNYSQFLEARDFKYRQHQAELARAKPKLISPEQAAGKRITGQEVTMRTTADSKGNPVTERSVTTFYDDGTMSKEENSKGGWFWT